ncbi:RNA polymerase I, second largest subunit, partial [Pseudoloma neurophilia]
ITTNITSDISTNITANKIISYDDLHYDLLFSYVASTIPFLEYNQSPRNMYQCQMVKQAMSYNTISNITGLDRIDKSYTLNHLHKPLISTSKSALIGINIFISILCYTSYDMDDAMVLNKQSVERGLFDGGIYKTRVIDIVNETKPSNSDRKKSDSKSYMTNSRSNDIILPDIGVTLKKGDPFYTIYNNVTYYNDYEQSVVHCIRRTPKYIIITLRIRRLPVLGDKFCSRHGQKGVMSYKMKQTDLPFNNNGMVPDLIINPHAFPSRMTIGMIMEIFSSHLALYTGKTLAVPPFHFSSYDDSFSCDDYDSSFCDD